MIFEEKSDYTHRWKALIYLTFPRDGIAQSDAAREQLHLSDGPHHQVLRRAELIDLQGFAGSEVKLRISSGT